VTCFTAVNEELILARTWNCLRATSIPVYILIASLLDYQPVLLVLPQSSSTHRLLPIPIPQPRKTYVLGRVEMETSAEDRFASLFTSDTKPAASTNDGPSLYEREHPATPEPKIWKTPEKAQEPRRIPGPRPNPGAADDVLTSSDDDDYIVSFSRKPTMQVTQMKKSKRTATKKSLKPGYNEATGDGAATSLGSPEAKITKLMVDDFDTDDDSDRPLPAMNKLGHLVTGHFCQFNLVKRFPYKYLDDTNDRVSKRFFANDKFFGRTWDL
jgi:hypothetical protein